MIPSTQVGARIFSSSESISVAVGAICEVTVEKIVFGGDGLARIGSQAVFIPLSAPGDHLRVRITEVARSYARAVIEEILSPSPARRNPPCPHFGECGGCQLQQLTYEAQLVAKAEFVRESLHRLGHIEWAGEIPVRSASEFGYRARAEIKVQRDKDKTQIGYFCAGTHDICEVRDCPILLPAVSRELQSLHTEAHIIPSDATRVFLTAGDREVLVTPGTGENSRAAEFDEMGTAYQRINSIEYGFGVRSFFQSNRLLVEDLVKEAVDNLRGRVAVDLYAGVGLFSLQLARNFREVHAVEGNRLAVSHGQANAQANNISNVRYESISVEAWLKYKATAIRNPDLLLLDPPRAGAGAQVISRIAQLAPRQIVYVSCDPATLARDLRTLVNAGYQIDSLVAFDMFPQTFHVETVAKLSRTL